MENVNLHYLLMDLPMRDETRRQLLAQYYRGQTELPSQPTTLSDQLARLVVSKRESAPDL